MLKVWLTIVAISLFTNIFSLANASEVLIGGSGTDIATMRLMSAQFNKQHPDITIKVLPSLGSGGGIKALSKGKLQIGLSSRSLKPGESSYPIHAYRYARTPLVFATQSTSTAISINTSTYFAALLGEKKYWPDGKLLRPILRPSSDSDTLLLVQTFPEAEYALNHAYQQRGVPVASTDQKAARALETIQGSLGTSTLAVILSEKRKIKALTLNNIEPTPENLGIGKYPMGKDLFLILPQSPRSDVVKFVNFVRSDQGAKILKATGHLPVPFKLE